MSAVCPACGVAVIPGYVKCPKCHAALPSFRRGRPTEAGGTSVPDAGPFPFVPVVAAVVLAAGIVAWLALRGGKPAPDVAAPVPAEQQPEPVARTQPANVAEAPSTTTTSAGSLSATASDLERALKKRRLWATVELVGTRVDIRSSACSDPAMAPLVSAAVEPLHAAGASKLRCLAQAGALVFERDL